MLAGQELGNKSKVELALVMIHWLHQRHQFQGGTILALLHFCSAVHLHWVLFRTQESQIHHNDEVANSVMP